MHDRHDRGRRLAEAVAARVLVAFPRVTVKVHEDIPGLWGTVVELFPPNPRGARMSLIAAWDWSWDLNVGRFKVCEMESTTGTEVEHVERVVEAITSIATHGYRRSWADRMISFGRDRVGPWES